MRFVLFSFGAEPALPLPTHAENPIDRIRPDAPERAANGSYPVGVVTHAHRAGVVAAQGNEG